MAKNYIVKKSTGTVYLRHTITKKEEAEVREKFSHWTIKPCKPPREKVAPHEITEEFNIPYDKVQKEDMFNYLKMFKTEEDLKAFAQAAHKSKKGEVKKTKKTFIIDGNKVEKEVYQYFHLAAKDYFFETHFAERWKAIKAMKEERKEKFKKAKTEEAQRKENMELELQNMLIV